MRSNVRISGRAEGRFCVVRLVGTDSEKLMRILGCARVCQNTVDFRDIPENVELITLSSNSSPLRLLPAGATRRRVGFAPTGDRRLSRHTIFSPYAIMLQGSTEIQHFKATQAVFSPAFDGRLSFFTERARFSFFTLRAA